MHVCATYMWIAHAMDVTLWYGVGVVLGGVGACSHPCEFAHAMDATLFKFMWSCTSQWCYALVWGGIGVGWGGGMFTFMWSCTRQWCYALVWAGGGVGWGGACSRSCEVARAIDATLFKFMWVAHASDATLWYWYGVGLGGVGACSRLCEVAHVSDATLWYGLGVGLGGVGACQRPCEVAHASDATLFKFMWIAHAIDATLCYGVGIGLCGVGACSRSCEVAHAMDATLFKFMWSCTRHGGYVIAHALRAIVWHIFNTPYMLLSYVHALLAVELWKEERHAVERNSCPAVCTVICPTVWKTEIQNVAAIGFCRVLSMFDEFLVHVLNYKMLIFN